MLGALVLEALVELDTVAPREGMRVMRTSGLSRIYLFLILSSPVSTPHDNPESIGQNEAV